MRRRNFIKSASAVIAVAMLASGAALAEWKPRLPINVIVPYKPGGGTDSFARALTANSKGAIAVPLTIVNKPGSSGITGATVAAGARPDGNTIMLTSSGSFLLSSMMRETKVNPIDSFRVIAQVGSVTASLMVPHDSPYKSIDDLAKAIKANPGKLRWAHTGRGGFLHVAGQGFLNTDGLKAVDVPFKGGSATRAAVIGEQVDFAMIGIQQAAGFEGKLRPIGLVSDKRDAFAKDVPTFAEQGYTVPLITSPMTVYAPKGTPDDIVAGLEAALRDIAAKPEFAEMMAKRGNAPAFLPGAEARAALIEMRDEVKPIIEALK